MFRDLDVDRYMIDGRMQQVVLAARELNRADVPVTTWEGKHLAYTHGYGVALAPASEVRGNGSPNYLSTGEGGSGPLLTEPEIYFGEGLDSYSVVATERAEISLNDQTSSYSGDGGVKMSSGLRRAAFALRFGEYNLLGSGLINKDSRILYIRDVRERAQTLAPVPRLRRRSLPRHHERADGLGARRLHDELAATRTPRTPTTKSCRPRAACATRTTTCATR